MLKIFITSLESYNNGELKGEWVSLPNDKIEEIYNKIKVNKYDELFITDFDTDVNIQINEFDNIEKLNKLAEQIEELDEYELLGLNAYLENGEDVEYAIEHAKDIIVYDNCSSMEDVAYQYAEESGLIDEIPENLQGYFDYKKLARDMEIENTFIDFKTGYIELVA